MSQTKAQLIDPVDGSIVNADINASAAIAGTKISPDFGSQAISTTGGLSINGATVFNESSADVDFRIESNDKTHMFFVDAGNNRIGVNVDTPLTTLHAKGDLYLTLNGSNANEGNALKFQTKTGGFDTNYGAAIHGLRVGNSSSYLRFDTGGQSEKMRLDENGRLGIGTTNLGSHQLISEGGKSETGGSCLALKTSGGANSVKSDLALYGTFVSPTSDQATRRSADIVSGFATNNWGNEFLAFHVGKGGSANDSQAVTDERMRITGAGKVGIGTTSPNRTLTVQSNGGQMSINDTDNTNGGIFCNAGTFSLYARGNSNLGDGGTGGIFEVQTHEGGGSTSQKFRIDGPGKLSTGNEGSPDVSGGGLCLNQGSASTNIFSCKSSDIAHGRTAVDETDTWFSLRKVSDNKGGAFIHGYTDQSGGDPAIHLAGCIDSQAPSFRAIQITGSRKNVNNAGTAPFSSGNPIVRISNDFDTTVASFTADGLAFNDDTAAANSLGDYEEGTWTPSIVNGGSPSYSQQSGLYTKIGNLVTHIFVMSFSGASLGTSSRIQGLPFAYDSTFETNTNMGRIGAHWNDAESAGNRVCHAVGHTGQGTTRIYVDLLTSGTDKSLRGFFQMRVP